MLNDFDPNSLIHLNFERNDGVFKIPCVFTSIISNWIIQWKRKYWYERYLVFNIWKEATAYESEDKQMEDRNKRCNLWSNVRIVEEFWAKKKKKKSNRCHLYGHMCTWAVILCCFMLSITKIRWFFVCLCNDIEIQPACNTTAKWIEFIHTQK